METIHSPEEFQRALYENKAVLAYFSTYACSVCHVLKPKVADLITANFPQIKTLSIQSDQLPELAAQNRIFAAPTVLVFFEGRETIRKSRVFALDDLKMEILRPYSLLFE